MKITLDSEQLMLKEKRISASVWSGIESFEHLQGGEYFCDQVHAINLWLIKTRLYSIINSYSYFF